MSNPILLNGLQTFGVENAEEKAEKLQKYVEEILLFNPTLKLVGDKTEKDLIVRHILDCAAGYQTFLKETQPGDTIADLGSGSGLPGLVLSILLPDRNFVLIERMQRRVGFLRGEIAGLRLKNVKVDDRDLKMVDDSFTVVTCRAFHPLVDIAEDVTKLSSRAIMYKGQVRTTEEELNALSRAGYTYTSRVVELSVPGMKEERHLVLLDGWKKEEA